MCKLDELEYRLFERGTNNLIMTGTGHEIVEFMFQCLVDISPVKGWSPLIHEDIEENGNFSVIVHTDCIPDDDNDQGTIDNFNAWELYLGCELFSNEFSDVLLEKLELEVIK